ATTSPVEERLSASGFARPATGTELSVGRDFRRCARTIRTLQPHLLILSGRRSSFHSRLADRPLLPASQAVRSSLNMAHQPDHPQRVLSTTGDDSGRRRAYGSRGARRVILAATLIAGAVMGVVLSRVLL